MAPGKGNFILKLCRSHSSSLLFSFSFSSLPCHHPTHLREELFRVWRALGGMWAASQWPCLGGQRSPQPPLCGPQELGGPGGSLENRPSPSAFLRVPARGEGGRAPQRSSPGSPCTSAILPHRPRKHLERSSELSGSSKARREHLEGQLPPPAHV